MALRNVNLIVQRDQRILENEIKIFFMPCNDPLYVKLEKLEIMIRLVSIGRWIKCSWSSKSTRRRSTWTLSALPSSRRSRSSEAENAAQRCVNVLLELIKARVPYVVQAAVVVVANIFRGIRTDTSP